MTEELRNQLRVAAAGLDVPSPPTEALLVGGRRRRRRRQVGTAVAAAACVLAVVAGGVSLAWLGDRPDSSPAPAGPTPVPTQQASTGPTPGQDVTHRVWGSGTEIGGQVFGTPREQALSVFTQRLGDPDLVVGPKTMVRISGEASYSEDGDPLSQRWRYRAFSVSCWGYLCLTFGGQSTDQLQLRGWEVSGYRRWAAAQPSADSGPLVLLAGTHISLDSTWPQLRAAFPGVTARAGEGNTTVVDHVPWPAFSDGIGAWRLSGAWNSWHPHRANENTVVTRLSAGQGPEPGCC